MAIKFDNILPNQIFTVNDLLTIKPPRSREEMIRTIIDKVKLIDNCQLDYKLCQLVSIQSILGNEITFSKKEMLTPYLENLDLELLEWLYSWVKCFMMRYEYEDYMKDPSCISIDNVLRELLKHKFHCVGSGTLRKVFDLGDMVIKIPYSRIYRHKSIGIMEMKRELELYKTNPSLMAKVKPIKYQTQNGEIYENINIMEKLYIPTTKKEHIIMEQQIALLYPDKISWEFGYDQDEKLKVFDFD